MSKDFILFYMVSHLSSDFDLQMVMKASFNGALKKQCDEKILSCENCGIENHNMLINCQRNEGMNKKAKCKE